MQNQVKRAKKLAKQRARKKDYNKRKNINKQPPSKIQEFKKDITTVERDEKGGIKKDDKGNIIKTKVGTVLFSKRVKIRKKDKQGNTIPVIPLPTSRKNKVGKKDIIRIKEAEQNSLLPIASN